MACNSMHRQKLFKEVVFNLRSIICVYYVYLFQRTFFCSDFETRDCTKIMEMKDVSLSLYHYMCKHVVGTENHVKTIRLITVCDNLSCSEQIVPITSGSFGKGLQMRGSDIDIMYVSHYIEVHDNITPIVFNPSKTYFSMMTEDTKPGFAMLRLKSSLRPVMLNICEQFRGDTYLSNVLFKTLFLNECTQVVHGPCVSDINGDIDIAVCIHSQYWIKPASQWPMRSNNSWPHENIKQMIMNHGVLFVPIGVKGSPHEDLEWRISFSVGEKLLIYTFSHTQLLCYALMKILLTDVINTNSRCKDLLCSYYLKTMIFWISEELQPSVWTPVNLIPCFMRCLRRLIYCVQYQICPHYFIPENNLFGNRIEGLARNDLIDTLRELLSYEWRCILFSKQLSFVSGVSCNVQHNPSFLCYEDINKFLKSKIFYRVSTLRDENNNFSKAVYNIISCSSKKLKYFHAYFMSALCNYKCQSIYLSSIISNKNQYKQHNTCLSYQLKNTNHDTVSGWLMLASYFYKKKQYEKCLIIILYALSKSTLEKLFRDTELSVMQCLLVKWYLEKKQGVVRSLKFVLADYVTFGYKTFIPVELIIKNSFLQVPAVVYAHFLSFLCHYHLNNVREYRTSLRDLQLTIAEKYFIGEDLSLKAASYYCLGTALKTMGEIESANQAFIETVKLLH